MNIEKQIEKIINNTFANCWVDKRSDIAHIHKKMVEELKWELSTIIQKEREDAIKDIVKDIGNLKLKERKIDYSYVNIPEEWEAEPENIEKRGYNQAVREINNKIYLFITNNLSQTKGSK